MKRVFGIIAVLSVIAVVGVAEGDGNKPANDASYNAFKSMKYVDVPIPKFADAKKEIPVPVIDGNPELLKMYWYCWQQAFKHLRKANPETGFVSNYIDEAFNPQIYQWDTIFMLQFARYAHTAYPFINSLDNFYCKQHDNGYICRVLRETNGQDYFPYNHKQAINPPLFSWAEMETFKLTGDMKRFRQVFPVLEKYVEWLETGRRKEGTAHNLYWNTGLGCGMDNLPRHGSGWVDMSSQMVLQYDNLADMAEMLGYKENVVYFRKRADEISALINKWMWSEEDGLYYDVDDKGNHVKVKTIAAFWPMIAGVVPDEKIGKLVANLKDPKTFWRTIVFPALAADQKFYSPYGGYWRGGVWAPSNVAVIKGLERYGMYDFAHEASAKYVMAMSEVFKKTGTVWENYSPDSLSQGHPAKARFVGWSGCGPISLLIEDMIGIKSDAHNNIVRWDIFRSDRHGVQNLTFGKITASLVADERKSANDPLRITVNSSAPFVLQVNANGISRKFNISSGDNVVEVGGRK